MIVGAGIGILALILAAPVDAAGGTKSKAVKAAPTTSAKISEVLAKKEPQVTSSTGGLSLPSNCQQSRKRLFVEGEGWLVRRVTTCY